MIDDILSLEALRRALPERALRCFASVGSTNDEAGAWLRAGAPAGALVIADEQTRGRGTRGRAWHAPKGSALMFSVVMYPPTDQVARLTMIAALAVSDALYDHVDRERVGLKWFNDVMLDGRKVCGILSEATWEGDQLIGAVVGIGINVRVDFDTAPLAASAISLEPAARHPVRRIDLLRRVLDRLDWWMASGRADANAVFEAWRARLVTLGQAVTIRIGEEVISGLAETVEADGSLSVRMAEGSTRRIAAGEVL